MSGPDLRVALIGLGPKGLFALERLLDHLHAAVPRPTVVVDAYEPHATPGAGPVYDPRQPAYLRMNIAAERLDLWLGENSAVPPGERRSFAEWRAATAGSGGGERYPPRALVGRYLSDGLDRMRVRMPDEMSFRVIPHAAASVRRDGARWTVSTPEGSCRTYDEVLIATGHGAWEPPWSRSTRGVPSVFPVARWLTPERIPAAAVVGVRGFALTFIDAALALTEGRGGSFEGDGHPYRLRYLASPSDVAEILPFSRSGRPMLAKPEPELAASIPHLGDIAQSGRDRILALAAPVELDDLLLILATSAGAGVLAADGGRPAGEALGSAASAAMRSLASACDGRSPVAGGGAAAEIERSLAVGAGRARPGIEWALGHTWQALYPALIERAGPWDLAPRAWPSFCRLAAEMERLAFGPPPVNAAKLLALVAAGTVNLTHVAGGRVRTGAGGLVRLGDERTGRVLDTVVDAVLAPPGAGAGGVLVSELVAAGYARAVSGRRGLEVADDGACVGRSGVITPGLSATGRPTEDCVIGNDTLFRHLHPHPDRWARRIVARAQEADHATPATGRRRVTV